VYALEDGDIDTAAMASASAPATPPTTVPAAMGSDPNLSSKSGSDPIPLQGAGAPGPAFAMGSATAMGSGPIPADPTAALAGTLQGAGDAVLAHWMAQISQLVQAAPSPGALQDALLAAFGNLPTEQLTEVMAMAFAAAQLAGMAAVAGEP
jgi:hypothetical protein